MLFCCVRYLRQWAFEGNRCLAVFPKVDGLSGRGLRQPTGLTPLGCQGSACERLRLTGSLRAPPRELYSTALCVSRMGYASQPKLASSLPNKRSSFYSADRLGRWAPGGASINAAFRRRPPFGGWRHQLRHGVKRVTGFSVAQGLPTNPVPLPPQLRWWDYGYSALCHMTLQGSGELTSPSGVASERNL